MPRAKKKGQSTDSGYVYPFVSGAQLTEIDMGVDVSMSPGDPIAAIGNCEVVGVQSSWYAGQPFLTYKLLDGPKSGSYVYVAEQITDMAHGRVSAGDPVCRYASSGTAIEIGWGTSTVGQTRSQAQGEDTANRHHGDISDPKNAGTPSGRDFYEFLQQLKKGGTISGDGGGGGGGLDLAEVEKISKAAAFATYLELPGLLDGVESMALTGERSLMNDTPLLPFVEQLARASLRQFMSMPTGEFYAFYPDYFGGLSHSTPYWEVDDIEIIDGQISLSDDELATHVYTVGDISGYPDGITLSDKLQTGGVVTIFSAFMADFLNQNPGTPSAEGFKYVPPEPGTPSLAGKTPDDKSKAINFLQKYGARPYYEEIPLIRNPFYEAFYAYQTFCLMWSRQFTSQFTFTFMPELFPGGIVAFPDHGIQMFIEEVSHVFDYVSGFQTNATLMAPAALPNASRQNLHSGMIRAWPSAPTPTKTGSK